MITHETPITDNGRELALQLRGAIDPSEYVQAVCSAGKPVCKECGSEEVYAAFRTDPVGPLCQRCTDERYAAKLLSAEIAALDRAIAAEQASDAELRA